MTNDADIAPVTDRKSLPSMARLKSPNVAGETKTKINLSGTFSQPRPARPSLPAAAVLILLLPLLAACAGIPVQSLYQLSRIDFATTDPVKIRAAVRLPFQVSPLAGSVILTMTAYDDGDVVFGEEKFVLEHLSDADELADLIRLVKPDTAVTAFRIRLEDLPRLKRFHGVTMRKPGGGKRGGALILTAKGCLNGSQTPKKIPMTTFLKTVETQDYFQISPEIDLLGNNGPQKGNGDFRPCGAPPA